MSAEPKHPEPANSPAPLGRTPLTLSRTRSGRRARGADAGAGWSEGVVLMRAAHVAVGVVGLVLAACSDGGQAPAARTSTAPQRQLSRLNTLGLGDAPRARFAARSSSPIRLLVDYWLTRVERDAKGLVARGGGLSILASTNVRPHRRSREPAAGPDRWAGGESASSRAGSLQRGRFKCLESHADGSSGTAWEWAPPLLCLRPWGLRGRSPLRATG